MRIIEAVIYLPEDSDLREQLGKNACCYFKGHFTSEIMLKIKLLLFTIFYFGQIVCAQSVQDRYDLEFRACNDSDWPWLLAPVLQGKGGCSMQTDTLTLLDGKHPLVFSSMEMFKGRNFFWAYRVNLCQQMYIPGDFKEIEFLLNAKCCNVKNAWLKIRSSDCTEQYWKVDSVPVVCSGEWTQCTVSVKNKNACFFQVEIGAAETQERLNPAHFFIDRMEIRLDQGRFYPENSGIYPSAYNKAYSMSEVSAEKWKDKKLLPWEKLCMEIL